MSSDKQPPLLPLADRRILVTGATGHFGRAVSAAIESAGGDILLAGSRDFDIDSQASTSSFIGGLTFDGLVHAAGALHNTDEAVICTNLVGMLNVLQACMRHGEAITSAVLLSGGGVGGPASYNTAAYGAAKIGVAYLAEAYSSKIRINALAPGSMRSKMNPACEVDHTEQAVACCLWLLSDASAHVNGRLISAVRDPWPFGPEVLGDNTYRLRRIEP